MEGGILSLEAATFNSEVATAKDEVATAGDECGTAGFEVNDFVYASGTSTDEDATASREGEIGRAHV